MKIVKLTESDLARIVERVLNEQIAAPSTTTPLKTGGPISSKLAPDGVVASVIEPLQDSIVKQMGAVKNAQGKWVFPCLKKLESMKVAGSTAKYDVAGRIYTFFTNGKYSREDKNGKTQGTWKCDTQGFVEIDGKQKLGQEFQWKPSPTEEEVRDGKKLLRYGMMGDFVKKVQETLGFTGRDLDAKFGKKTLNAVKDFQKKSGLKDDGLVGKNTYAALFASSTQKTTEPKAPETNQAEKTNVKPLEQPRVAPQQQSPQVQRQTQIPPVTTNQTRRTARATEPQASTNQIPTDSF